MCALRFMDSWDHYVTADLPEKWTLNGGGVIVAGQGRRSTAGFRIGTFTTLDLTRDNQATWIVGVAMRLSAMPTGTNQVLDFRDVTSVQCDVCLTPSGTITVRRGASTVLGTTTYAVPISTYVYLEILLTVHNTTGVVAIHVDGIERLNLTAQNTRQTTNNYANQIRLWGPAANTDFDDFYLCDGTGSAPTNTFLGDCRVDCLLPTGDGSNSAWTCSSGTTHATLVDETAPNDNTDYVSTSTAAARDSYAMGNLSAMTAPVIYGVQQLSSMAKDDAGTRQVKNLLKSGATTQAGSTTHTLASSFAYYADIWAQDPNTAAAWTTAAIDALEAGVENV